MALTDQTLSKATSGIGVRPPDMSALMALAQDGDKASYALVLRECETVAAAIALASGMVGPMKDQMVADTLLTIHQARHTYDPTRSFSIWIQTISRCQASLHQPDQRAARRAHSWVRTGLGLLRTSRSHAADEAVSQHDASLVRRIHS